MRRNALRTLTAGCMLLALAACSTDSPTAPQRTPAPPPGSGPTTNWNVNVTVDPRNVTVGSLQPATVRVQIRRAADGAAPQRGSTAVVSADLGDFNAPGSGIKSVVVTLSGGVAELLYFAGDLLGTDTIRAQLENSVGSASVNILEAAVLFLESVAPDSGPQGGGTRIRISGTGFSEPARVIVGSINARVDAVGKDAQGEFIRAFTGAVFDPDTFFSTEGCDSDGDGTEDGARYLPKTVEVTVEFATGETATLSNAFTYRPSDRSCRDLTPDPDRPRADFGFTVNGLTVLFDNRSTPAGLSYNWIFGDGVGTSTSENPIYTYAVGGMSYDVTLRATNASGSSTITKTVTLP